MFKTIANIFRVPDIRKRLFFTIGVLIVYRIGMQIPVPGVNLAELLRYGGGGGGGPLSDFLNLFTGGGLQRASIFSLGIMPYITTMIIMQLLTAVVPAIDQMLKEGPEGRKKFQNYGRLGTVGVTMLQSFIHGRQLVSYNASAPTPFLTVPNFSFILLFVGSVTAGTMVLMWMGEQITEQGLGNGISLLIMAGIIARMPASIYQLVKSQVDPINLLIVLGIFAVVIGIVVFEESGLRKIPVQYAKRYVGTGRMAAQVSFLPFKVNPTGVIPIIFASAILMFPAQISQWIGHGAYEQDKEITITSPNYPQEYSGAIRITNELHEKGATRMILHFADLHLEKGKDHLYIYDERQKKVADLTGFKQDFEVEVNGEKATLIFVTDNEGNAKGWKIDSVHISGIKSYARILSNISNALLPGRLWYSVVYFLMIIFFAYFYTEIELNPHDIAENLRRQGGFIPGVRPGQKTEEYIAYILNRITFPGAIFLGTVALLPTFVISAMDIPPSMGYLMGGTSLLIMVGVALDTLLQLESHLLMHHMDGFLTRKKHR